MNKNPIHPDAALLERNGGVSSVAQKTGYSIQRVSNWRTRGIPSDVKLKFPSMFLPNLMPTKEASHA